MGKNFANTIQADLPTCAYIHVLPLPVLSICRWQRKVNLPIAGGKGNYRQNAMYIRSECYTATDLKPFALDLSQFFVTFLFSLIFRTFRCNWMISKFMKLNFLLKMFTFFHLFLWKSPIPWLLGVFNGMLLPICNQNCSKNATLSNMETTVLVIDFKCLEILLLVKTIDQKLVAMTFEK